MGLFKLNFMRHKTFVLHDQHGMIPGIAAVILSKSHVTLQRHSLLCQTEAEGRCLGGEKHMIQMSSKITHFSKYNPLQFTKSIIL